MIQDVEIEVKRDDPDKRPITVMFADRAKVSKHKPGKDKAKQQRTKSFTILVPKSVSVEEVAVQAQSLLEGMPSNKS